MLKKFQLAVAVIAIAILLSLPTIVFATHGFGSSPTTVMVDGETFELWGFGGDGPVPAFRLQDIAYMFRGTPAQFDIRTPPDERWDFWIVRGAAYTPQGTELCLDFEERIAVFGSYGFVAGGLGFDGCPLRTVIVGIDGDNEPATTIALAAIEDPDGMFFEAWGLLSVLGVDFDWDNIHPYPNVSMTLTTETATPVELPFMSAELVSILLRAGGHWVDRAHFYSPIIDESVVWPVGFHLSITGFTDINASLAPINIWQGTTWWYPVSMRELESGYVELTVDIASPPRLSRGAGLHEDGYYPPDDAARFYNHRMVFDASREWINEITYYVGDVQFRMMRNDWRDLGRTDARRYTVAPADGGGIVLRYVLGENMVFLTGDREFRIYRSTKSGERGELLLIRESLAPHDRLLFEFVDETVVYGNVYYYSIYTFSPRWEQHSMISGVEGSRGQYVVDVNEVLGLPPGYAGSVTDENVIPEPEVEPCEEEESEVDEPEVVDAIITLDHNNNETSSPRHWLRIVLLMLVALFLRLQYVVWRRRASPV